MTGLAPSAGDPEGWSEWVMELDRPTGSVSPGELDGLARVYLGRDLNPLPGLLV